MYKYYLSYNECSTGGEICEGQEGESFPDREPTYYTFTPKQLFKGNPNGHWLAEEIESEEEFKDGQGVFLAWIKYSSGDTFGCSYGHKHIVGVYSSSERASKALKEELHGSGYKPWEGYFESLESTEIDFIPFYACDLPDNSIGWSI